MSKKKNRTFKTEVHQLLNLVIHSLYSNREIFLRELISNASDAIDRARFEAVSNDAVQEPESGWKIKLIPNKDAKTLTIRDNGIGMNLDEVEQNISTIAHSGTKAFLKNLQEADADERPDLIGQFGVGFYSAFMVADTVDVITKKAGSEDPAIKWSSKGEGKYSIEEVEKETTGTDIILHLKEDQQDYLEEWKLRQTVKKYSDYVAFPITMDVTKQQSKINDDGEVENADEMVEVTEEDTLNSMKALWVRPKNEITQEEYAGFYKAITHDFNDPAKVIHYSAEGALEFHAVLFVPEKAPMDLMYEMQPKGIQLYVRRVFIMNDTIAMLPPYLRFMKGVVDSSDLPLNVSREILQEEALLQKIQKNIVTKILNTLKEWLEKDRDAYTAFWQELGKVFKEGMHSDFANKEKIQDLLLFESTAENNEQPMTTLKEYVERMPETQKAIYYLAGEDRNALLHSPHLEALRKKGYEVLLMTDTIDEWVLQALTEYNEKPLQSVDSGNLDLHDEEEKKEIEEKTKTASEQYAHVLESMKKHLQDEVSDVRFSSLLTESASALVADPNGINKNMQRIMQQMGQEVPDAKRILELNPSHPLLAKLAEAEEEKITQYAELLYGQALLTEGSALKNPSRFTRLVSDLMA